MMKLILRLVLVAALTTSCVVTQECPVYEGSKGHVSPAGTRKAKAPKDRTPFYKVLKVAEKD